MVSFLKAKCAGRSAKPVPQRTTSSSFSERDLAELGHVIAVGQAVLQKCPLVVSCLKAAMTRMKVPRPKGL